MSFYTQFRIILIFSNYILHKVCYPSGSKTFFGLQSTWNFCTVHYTMKTLFFMPSIEMGSSVECNAVLCCGHGCMWGIARKRIVKNILSETATFCAFGKWSHWRFQGRNTAIQLAEYHYSARKKMGTNIWHNVTETADSECRNYFAWFQVSVDK
jgi:hypothetical protein